MLRLDVRVERTHTCKRLDVFIQRHNGNLDDLMVARLRAGRFQINRRQQVARQVIHAGIVLEFSHGSFSAACFLGWRRIVNCGFATGW